MPHFGVAEGSLTRCPKCGAIAKDTIENSILGGQFEVTDGDYVHMTLKCLSCGHVFSDDSTQHEKSFQLPLFITEQEVCEAFRMEIPLSDYEMYVIVDKVREIVKGVGWERQLALITQEVLKGQLECPRCDTKGDNYEVRGNIVGRQFLINSAGHKRLGLTCLSCGYDRIQICEHEVCKVSKEEELFTCSQCGKTRSRHYFSRKPYPDDVSGEKTCVDCIRCYITNNSRQSKTSLSRRCLSCTFCSESS